MPSMGPGHPAYDVDWIFASASDVHVANHRDWFTSYTTFKTHFESGFVGGPVEAEGIGEVKLVVKTDPNRSGSQYQHTVILHDVLYAPSASCNVLGMDFAKNASFTLGSGVNKVIDSRSGACVGILDAVKLFRLRLRGQSGDQTSLDRNKAYVIRANWPASERSRWEAISSQRTSQQPVRSDSLSLPSSSSSSVPPLTQSEKKWLKDSWGGEFKFLRDHGYSIYEEEDREEGRRLVRAFMEDEANMTKETTAMAAKLAAKIAFSESWRKTQPPTPQTIISLTTSWTGSSRTTSILATFCVAID
ncbi:hypothetical protein ACLMJK_006333 [Lecanora helva]